MIGYYCGSCRYFIVVNTHNESSVEPIFSCRRVSFLQEISKYNRIWGWQPVSLVESRNYDYIGLGATRTASDRMVADTVADSEPLSLMQLVIHPSGTGDTGFIQSPRTDSIVQSGQFVPVTCTCPVQVSAKKVPVPGKSPFRN